MDDAVDGGTADAVFLDEADQGHPFLGVAAADGALRRGRELGLFAPPPAAELPGRIVLHSTFPMRTERQQGCLWQVRSPPTAADLMLRKLQVAPSTHVAALHSN